jgi:hypothetical protein
LAWKFDAHSVVGAVVEAGFGIQFQLYKNGLDQPTSTRLQQHNGKIMKADTSSSREIQANISRFQQKAARPKMSALTIIWGETYR